MASIDAPARRARAPKGAVVKGGEGRRPHLRPSLHRLRRATLRDSRKLRWRLDRRQGAGRARAGHRAGAGGDVDAVDTRSGTAARADLPRVRLRMVRSAPGRVARVDAAGLQWQLSAHLLPFFKDHRLSEITIAEVDRYRERRSPRRARSKPPRRRAGRGYASSPTPPGAGRGGPIGPSPPPRSTRRSRASGRSWRSLSSES